MQRSGFILLGIFLIAVVGVIDYFTGYEISISIFYLIPILLVAWRLGKGPGLAMSLLGAASFFIANYFSSALYANPLIAFWNTAVRLGFFVIAMLAVTARQTSERRLKQIVEIIAEGLMVLDPRGRIVFANPAAQEILQLPGGPAKRESYVQPAGKLVTIDGKPLPEEALPLQQVVHSGKPVFGMEHGIEYPDGRRLILSVNASPLRELGGKIAGVVYTFSDITRRKQAERELIAMHDTLEEKVKERTAELLATSERLQQEIVEHRQTEEKRQEARRELLEQRALAIHADRLRSLGEMAASISHELNQPLMGVRGLSEHILIALDRGWKLPEKTIQEKARLIMEQADRMSHIIEHVRKFARRSDSTEKFPVQLNEVIQSTVGLIGEQFRIRGIELKCELDPDLPPVLGNPFSLEEVFVNLLSNCRDAIEERRDNPGLSSMCEPHVIVRTGVPKEKNRVEAEVIDHGTGIPKELIPRVFEPFFTTKDTKRGTGLGLPIAKSIIEDSGGEIDIRSTLGSGTSVIIRLPVLEKC